MDRREEKKRMEQGEENTKGMHRRLMKEVRADRGKLIMLLVLGVVSALAIGASFWAMANITNEVFLNGAGLDALYGGRGLAGRAYHLVDDGTFSKDVV